MLEPLIILAVAAMYCRYAYLYAPPSLERWDRILYSCIPLASLVFMVCVGAIAPHLDEEWQVIVIGSFALLILTVSFVAVKTLRNMAHAKGKDF
ncbi:hypothetical protein P8R33_00785 [Qipengyuania sp. XHP0211]|uniref:hypothetical protein n=1 Tax=Qipengyuania sp. XHP0211 TaxID=3038079 RepID=UPI00241E4F9F|nr:hypothetical protein [Qipengyuania sp. XHP0211]MDG5749638.1 hypothetical protein [Qipengyuania sp. XHP0211]